MYFSVTIVGSQLSLFLLLPLESLLAYWTLIWKSVAVYFHMRAYIAYVWVTIITVVALYFFFIMHYEVSIQLGFPLEPFSAFRFNTHKACHFKMHFTMGFQLALKGEATTTVGALLHVFCMHAPVLCKGSGWDEDACAVWTR